VLELLWLVRPILPEAVYNFLLEKLLVQFWEAAAIEEKLSTDLLKTSERGMLLDAIFKGAPAKAILEVGCGFGQNFWFLRRLLPKVPLTGVERDQSLFVEGRSLVEKLKLKKIDFVPADASKKLPLGPKSFHLSYTCAALLYTSADNIEAVISEMIRVTRNRILFLEQHQVDPKFEEQHLGVWVSKESGSGGYWLRDYAKLLSSYTEVKSVTVRKVPNPRFAGESWQETASLIEAELAG